MNPNFWFDEDENKNICIYDLLFDYESPLFYYLPHYTTWYFMPYNDTSLDLWNGLITFNHWKLRT